MSSASAKSLLIAFISLMKIGHIGAQISPFPSGFNCSTTIYSESFENGIPTGWNTLSLDRAKSNLFNEGWVIDRDTTFTTATGPTAAQDGSYFIYCDGSGPIGRGTLVALTSPAIDLTGAQAPSLTFYLNMHGRSGIFYVNIVDGLNVTQVLPTVDGNVIGGIHASHVWEAIYVDLGEYVDKTISIQLVAQKPDNPHLGDVSVDNIMICGAALPIPTSSHWSVFYLSIFLIGLAWKILR